MNLLRSVFFGLAVCVLVVLGLRLTISGTGTPPSAERQVSDKSALNAGDQMAAAHKLVENRLGQAPQFTAFYQQLASDFPHAYAQIVDNFAGRLVGSGTLPTPDAMILETLRDLQQGQGVLAAGADVQKLTDFFDARRAVLDALAPVDPRECADFLYGMTDLPLSDFSAAHRDLIAGLAGKQLAAIKDGENRRLSRAAPSAADIDLVAKGLAARNLSTDEIALLLDGKSLDPPLPDARLCDIGRIYLSVLQALPADARERIYGLAAELLARS